MLLPLIEKEIKNLFNAKIIVTLRFSKCVANLVHVRKKNGEITVCVDFRNLNKVSLKENYPLTKMDHISQKVVGAERISIMDGFSGYNHIKVQHKDEGNTSFTTPWGTFMYSKMPSGIMNAGQTFQRETYIAFEEEKYKFVVVYMDDIKIFSRYDRDHIKHLEHVFLKCRKFVFP